MYCPHKVLKGAPLNFPLKIFKKSSSKILAVSYSNWVVEFIKKLVEIIIWSNKFHCRLWYVVPLLKERSVSIGLYKLEFSTILLMLLLEGLSLKSPITIILASVFSKRKLCNNFGNFIGRNHAFWLRFFFTFTSGRPVIY